MASPYQQQSLRRKIVYIALIVGLFCATLVLRQLPRIGMEAQAAAIESAIERALLDGLRTRDLGGAAGTLEATQAVLKHL